MYNFDLIAYIIAYFEVAFTSNALVLLTLYLQLTK